MARRNAKSEKNGQSADNGITSITVAGFKSIAEEQTIEIRPLTILAGANSSGKSSMMQPLLLLKQTLEANYYPRAFFLNGPNVRFTSFDQLLSKSGKKRRNTSFSVEIRLQYKLSCKLRFGKDPGREIEIQEQSGENHWGRYVLRSDLGQSELPEHYTLIVARFIKTVGGNSKLIVGRDSCFLKLYIRSADVTAIGTGEIPLAYSIEETLPELIHVPGLRGNPERSYPVSGVGRAFPGTFENYVASVISKWQSEGQDGLVRLLSLQLEHLGLTARVQAKPINDAQVELRVGRLAQPTDDEDDFVNIADVGIGVSQTLPVLVALLVAKPGQLVYIEQPELHLHPRAQSAMAEVIADAARRGVRVVIETHSSLLILGIQSLVAEGKLSPDLVKLHWFKRRKDGTTEISTGDLDEAGAYGDWPEDFDDVTLQAASRYLDAAEARHLGS